MGVLRDRICTGWDPYRMGFIRDGNYTGWELYGIGFIRDRIYTGEELYGIGIIRDGCIQELHIGASFHTGVAVSCMYVCSAVQGWHVWQLVSCLWLVQKLHRRTDVRKFSMHKENEAEVCLPEYHTARFIFHEQLAQPSFIQIIKQFGQVSV